MRIELFYDGETGETFTKEEAYKLWLEVKENNETELENFGQWLNECTSKNGQLERIYKEI